MKFNLQRIFVAFVFTVFATVVFAAETADDCATIQQQKNYPSYYCDCKEGYLDFQLPIDTFVTDSIWYKGYVSDLEGGLSAYLHSDCDLNFEVYTGCTAKVPKYQKVFEQNEASAVDGDYIKRELEKNQVGDMDVAFYCCITPINGQGGRLVVRAESDGIPSDCDDPLAMLPGMSLYSVREKDVYVVNPAELSGVPPFMLKWSPSGYEQCQLQVTAASCDGPVLAQTTLDARVIYFLPSEIMQQAKENNYLLYFHFTHDISAPGKIQCLKPEYEESYVDTTLCQGLSVAVNDTLLMETTVYPIDTVHLHDNVYQINFIDVTFVAPEAQYDTLALFQSQMPYVYREQYTLSQFGDYDLTIHKQDQCDERFWVHVYNLKDTVVNVVDTFLCYGAVFQYEGRIYNSNTSIVKTHWEEDVLIVDSLNVYFSDTPELVYDTIVVNERKYGQYFKEEGDYSFTYINVTTKCVDSIALHVQASQDGYHYEFEYIDEELCQGLEYDYYGDIYTSSVCFRDTNVINDSTRLVYVVTIVFVEPDIQYDTLKLKSYQLPYRYSKYYTVDSFGVHDFTVHEEDECDERFVLQVIHDVDTVYQSVDTVLCPGTPFVHDGVEYTQAVQLNDSSWLDADTYLVSTINLVYLSDAVMSSDTLLVCVADLPYDWYGQKLSANGVYTHTESYTVAQCDSAIYEVVFGVYSQTLPVDVARPVVQQGKSIDVSWASVEVLEYIASDSWYAPNALVTWWINFGAGWDLLTDAPVANNVSKLWLKYTVETDCGFVESDEMEYTFVVTGVGSVESAESSARKVIFHDRLYIIRDGKMYNALGVCL